MPLPPYELPPGRSDIITPREPPSAMAMDSTVLDRTQWQARANGHFQNCKKPDFDFARNLATIDTRNNQWVPLDIPDSCITRHTSWTWHRVFREKKITFGLRLRLAIGHPSDFAPRIPFIPYYIRIPPCEFPSISAILLWIACIHHRQPDRVLTGFWLGVIAASIEAIGGQYSCKLAIHTHSYPCIDHVILIPHRFIDWNHPLSIPPIMAGHQFVVTVPFFADIPA